METFIGCSVIIYDLQERILIAQRSRNKKKFPLLWETIGGSLELNETPEECIRRETMEEIGCKLHDLKLFKVYVIKEKNEQYILIVFTGRIEDKIKTNYEIEDVKWITSNDINNYEFYSDNCREKILEYFIN